MEQARDSPQLVILPCAFLIEHEQALRLLVLRGRGDREHAARPSAIGRDDRLCDRIGNVGLRIEIAGLLRHGELASANLEFRARHRTVEAVRRLRIVALLNGFEQLLAYRLLLLGGEIR